MEVLQAVACSVDDGAMKSCSRCGASASESALKCPSCHAWMVAIAPPGSVPDPNSAPRTTPVAASGGAASLTADQVPATIAGALGTDLLPERAVASPQSHANASDINTDLLPRRSYTAPTRSVALRIPASGLSSRRLLIGGVIVVVVAFGGWFLFAHSHGATPPAAIPAARHTSQPTGLKAKRASMSIVQRRAADRRAESELREALTVEKVVYTDQQAYAASPNSLRAVEPSLAWGTRLHVAVADASSRGDGGVVCLSEKSRSGTTFAVADVALGPNQGTYYGPKACPSPISASAVARIGASFDTQ